MIILSAFLFYHIIFNITWRFALHFAFAFNMSKIRGHCCPKWKPEGLDLSAGPVPVFPIIYIYCLQRPENCSTLRKHFFANLAVPLTNVVCLKRRCSFDLLDLRLRFGPAASSNTFSRKEVFQPHLPVRLPCYDLAPITSFALGRSFR